LLQRDWLMRQIEMAGRMLAAIIAKARSGQQLEALGMFDQAYQPLLGVGARLLPVLSDEQLLAMLNRGGLPDTDRWPVLVRLLVTEADLYAAQGDEAAAVGRYRKALMLLRELGRGDPEFDPELCAHLADRMRAHGPEPWERIQLAELYERAGRFADAEDTLFEGLDVPGGEAVVDGEELTQAAIAFYRRLLAKDDEQLAAGNLPREEAQAGLAEVLARPPRV
jgi:tetratricopeptide (TPR) repeat protein